MKLEELIADADYVLATYTMGPARHLAAAVKAMAPVVDALDEWRRVRAEYLAACDSYDPAQDTMKLTCAIHDSINKIDATLVTLAAQMKEIGDG